MKIHPLFAKGFEPEKEEFAAKKKRKIEQKRAHFGTEKIEKSAGAKRRIA